MSDIFLLPFVALVLVSLCFIVHGKSNQPNPSQQKSLRIGGVLFGLAFTYFGVAGYLLSKHSQRPEVIGHIREVRIFNGSRSHDTNFRVELATGFTDTLSSNYVGDEIVSGELARVQYLAFDHTVLKIQVLDGKYAGWNFTQRSGELLWLAISLLLAAMGFYMGYKYRPSS